MRPAAWKDVDRATKAGGWWGEDFERHQVKALFGRGSTPHLAKMQAFCDEYGKPAEVAG